MDVRFYNDSVFTIAGPSSSGKTVFVQKLIKYRQVLFRQNVNNIHWYYGIIHPPKIPRVNMILHKGLTDGWSGDIKPLDMIVLDDLFVEAANNKEVTNAFTRLAHHTPCTILFITQNVFHHSTESRTRALNTHYLVLMKNPRDASQISYIARQMFPKNSNFLVESYRDATSGNAFSYMLLDFRQQTPEYMRVRSEIFPNENNIVYINNM